MMNLTDVNCDGLKEKIRFRLEHCNTLRMKKCTWPLTPHNFDSVFKINDLLKVRTGPWYPLRGGIPKILEVINCFVIRGHL